MVGRQGPCGVGACVHAYMPNKAPRGSRTNMDAYLGITLFNIDAKAYVVCVNDACEVSRAGKACDGSPHAKQVMVAGGRVLAGVSKRTANCQLPTASVIRTLRQTLNYFALPNSVSVRHEGP